MSAFSVRLKGSSAYINDPSGAAAAPCLGGSKQRSTNTQTSSSSSYPVMNHKLRKELQKQILCARLAPKLPFGEHKSHQLDINTFRKYYAKRSKNITRAGALR